MEPGLAEQSLNAWKLPAGRRQTPGGRAMEGGPIVPKLPAAVVMMALVGVLPLSAAGQDGGDAPSPDLRLSRPVTLNSQGEITSVMEELSDASKVAFSVYPSRHSWWISELKLSIAVREAPASKVKDAIADLLDLRWARYGKESNWSYALWQDRKGRERQQALLNEGKAKQLEPIRVGARSIADLARSAASLSSDARQEAMSRDPVTRFLLTDPFGKSYAGLMSALAPALESAQSSPLSSRLVEIPVSSLSGPQRAAVREFTRQAALVEARVSGGEPTDRKADWDRAVIRIARGPEGSGPPPGLTFAELDIEGVAGMHGFPLMGRDSELLRVFSTYIPRLNAGEDPKALEQEVEQVLGKDLERLQKAEDTEPRPWMSAPDLQKKVRIAMKPDATGPDLLQALAEQSGIPVLCECWSVQPLGLDSDKEQTVAEALDAILRRWQMTCAYRRGFLLLTAPDRLQRREGMVPAAQIKQLTARCKKQSGLTASDLAEIITAYNPEQVLTLMKERELRESTRLLGSSGTRAALNLYASLSNQERAAAASAGGIPVSSLNGGSWDLLAAALRASGAPQDWSRHASLQVAYVKCPPNEASYSSDLGPGEWLVFSTGGDDRRTVPIGAPPAPPPSPPQPKQSAQ